MKKIISITILFGLCSLIFCTPSVTFAEDSNKLTGNISSPMSINGLKEPTQEELDEEQAYYNDPEIQAEIAEKEARAAALANSGNSGISLFSTTSSGEIAIPGTFTLFTQPNNYYCVPACLKSVINYIEGTAASQGLIAIAIGTDSISGSTMSSAFNYLTNRVDFAYIRTTGLNKTNMCNNIYATIANDDKPCIVGVNILSSDNWHYGMTASSGWHCVVLNAIWSDKSKIQVADPIVSYLKGEGIIPSNSSPFYYVESTKLNTVYQRAGTAAGLIW